MKYILPLVVSGFLFSCGNAEDKQVHDSATTAVTTVPAITEVQPYRPDIATTPWDGDLTDAIYWRDTRGENAVIVSVKPQYFWEEENPKAQDFFPSAEDPETLSELTEIFVTHYVLKSGEAQWKQFSQHHDYLFGCCDVYMAYQPASLQVMDADSNGTGEYMLMYHQTEGDGMLSHYYLGTLLLGYESEFYTIEDNTGLGYEIEMQGKSYVLDDDQKLNLPANPMVASLMGVKWRELYLKKVEQDRAEVTEQNNVDEEGHADHQH